MNASLRAPRGTASTSRARAFALRVLVVLFALAVLIPGFGLADLTTPINPKWHEGYVSEVGYGALAGIIIPVGFLAQLRSPERRIAGLQQVAATVPAYIAAGVLGGDDDFLPFAATVAVAVAITLALHPAPRRFVARGTTFRPVLALLALAAAVPLTVYGLEAAANQRADLPPPRVRFPRATQLVGRARGRGFLRRPGCAARVVGNRGFSDCRLECGSRRCRLGTHRACPSERSRQRRARLGIARGRLGACLHRGRRARAER